MKPLFDFLTKCVDELGPLTIGAFVVFLYFIYVVIALLTGHPIQ